MNRIVSQLRENWDLYLQSERELSLNKIDKEVIELLLSAKKSYRKLRIGEILYSPELSKQGLT